MNNPGQRKTPFRTQAEAMARQYPLPVQHDRMAALCYQRPLSAQETQAARMLGIFGRTP